jgi:mono/diheme cytochrome c family protein
LALAIALPITQGCGKRAEVKARASATPSFLEFEVPRRPPPSAQTIARGRAVYLANCVQCHGPNGAGDGFGAPLSVTFRIDEPGRYKFYCATQCSTTDLHPRMNGTLIVE